MDIQKWAPRLVSLLACLVLVLSLSTPVSAATGTTEGNSEALLQEWVTALEQKYDIRIRYELDDSGEPVISSGTMYMLDTSLDVVTPQIVRQVSAHYQGKTGIPLTFSFEYSPFHAQFAGMEVVGLFEEEKARIRLLLPYTSNGTFTTGAAPLTMVHEFAHALHTMCGEVVGKETLEQEWRALNGSARYNTGYFGVYSQTTFITSYAATSYEEDFADAFSHALVRNKAGQGFSQRLLTSDGSYTALGNKVVYIGNLLRRVFQQSGTAVENLNKAFTTPTTLEYQGLLISGEDLQFIGYSAPRYVRGGILKNYELHQNSSVWIRDIGGWQVEGTDGSYYLVFPGGTAVQLSRRLRTAA